MDTWDEFGRPLPEAFEPSKERPEEMDRQDLNDEAHELRKLVGQLRAVNRTLRKRIERQAVALADAREEAESLNTYLAQRTGEIRSEARDEWQECCSLLESRAESADEEIERLKKRLVGAVKLFPIESDQDLWDANLVVETVKDRDARPGRRYAVVNVGNGGWAKDELAARTTLSKLRAESIAREPKLVTMDCPRCGSDRIETRQDAFCCSDCDAYIGGPDGLAVRPRPV